LQTIYRPKIPDGGARLDAVSQARLAADILSVSGDALDGPYFDPAWAPLWNLPRFRELVEKYG
jgi:hypothetical protein